MMFSQICYVYCEDYSVVCVVVLRTVGGHGGGRVHRVDARIGGINQDDPDHIKCLIFYISNYII